MARAHTSWPSFFHMMVGLATMGRQAFGEGDAELAFIPSPDAFDE